MRREKKEEKERAQNSRRERREEEEKLTFLDLIASPDEIVDEILKIAERVGDASSLVDLRERSVEDGDDVLEQLGSRSLKWKRRTGRPRFESRREFEAGRKSKTHLEDQSNHPLLLPQPRIKLHELVQINEQPPFLLLRPIVVVRIFEIVLLLLVLGVGSMSSNHSHHLRST